MNRLLNKTRLGWLLLAALFIAPFLLGWITPAEYFYELKTFIVERILF